MQANKNFTSDPTNPAHDEELGLVEETSHTRDVSSDDSSEYDSGDEDDQDSSSDE